MKLRRVYEVVIIVLLALFLFMFIEMDKNYNELLGVNDDLINQIDTNRENYNKNWSSMNEQIEDLMLEVFEKDQRIEELEAELDEATKIQSKVSDVTYTQEEYETLAHLLYAEAGGSSDLGIIYVGSVVMNRVNSDKFPNTLLEVIYQDGQYSPTWNGFMNREVENESCYRIARYLLENGSVIPSEVLGQADYTIYKRWGSKLYAEVDGNYFFYLKEDE